MKSFTIMLYVALCIGMCTGCNDRHSDDGSALAGFDAEVGLIREDLLMGNGKYPHHEFVRRIDNLMAAFSNSTSRTAAARSYSTMLKDLDVSSVPYKRRSTVVRLYGEHVLYSFQLTTKNGLDFHEAIRLFSECLAAWRDACLTVSGCDRMSGESETECRERLCCFRTVKDARSYTTSILRRFWLPRLSEYLPEEFHQEFRRAISPVLDWE